MPKSAKILSLAAIVAAMLSAGDLARAADVAAVTVAQTPRGAVVKLGDDVFCEYLTQSGFQPAIWPIYGPTGAAMTRAYPMASAGEHEREDHPHHRSLWFAHGDVNGFDFWANHGKQPQPGIAENRIVHREFAALASRGGIGVIDARNDWVSRAGEKVCEDRRVVKFGVDVRGENPVRWIDFKITLTASDGDVTFGDTKEGTFATRVAGTMKVDAELGGQIVNSEGRRNADAWGQPADWVDYYGPVDGETVGIAMFSYPSNFRHPCRWHVRTYGLFAANPFGMHHFPKGEPKQGAVTIKDGESLTLHYRVLLHRGDVDEAKIAERYREFAKVEEKPLETSPQGKSATPPREVE